LITLFDSAVGFYAFLVNINAYRQPGVEAGKKAAANIIDLQGKILAFLSQNPKQSFTIGDIAKTIELTDGIEYVFKICEHLSANSNHKVQKITDKTTFSSKYGSSY
jgi:glucose-6-phosphate isomerase